MLAFFSTIWVLASAAQPVSLNCHPPLNRPWPYNAVVVVSPLPEGQLEMKVSTSYFDVEISHAYRVKPKAQPGDGAEFSGDGVTLTVSGDRRARLVSKDDSTQDLICSASLKLAR